MNCLPVARPPAFVAETKSVHLEDFLADLETAFRSHVLLVMRLGEGLLRVKIKWRSVFFYRLAAEHGRNAFIVEFNLARDDGVFLERLGRVRHVERV